SLSEGSTLLCSSTAPTRIYTLSLHDALPISGWVDGRTLAFLVDFLEDDGEIAFRIYYQDATAPPPLGFAPDALVAAHPVDVAILVPATFEEVDWHPEARSEEHTSELQSRENLVCR